MPLTLGPVDYKFINFSEENLYNLPRDSTKNLKSMDRKRLHNNFDEILNKFFPYYSFAAITDWMKT